MIELLGKNLTELQAVITEAKFPRFRAKQIMDYIYKRYVFDFADMQQLPGELRAWLSENCAISVPKIVTEKTTPDGQTKKLLLELADGNRVETVLMKQQYGNSVCIFTSGLRHGLRFLCVYYRRFVSQFGNSRNCGASLIVWCPFKRTDSFHRCDGRR